MSKFKIWYEEDPGVLRADIYERFSLEEVNAFVDYIVDNYDEAKHKYALIYMGDEAQSMVDKETRKLVRERAQQVKWGKIAILGAKSFLRMFAKIAVTALGKADVTRFVDSEEEGLAWLKGEMEKETPAK